MYLPQQALKGAVKAVRSTICRSQDLAEIGAQTGPCGDAFPIRIVERQFPNKQKKEQCCLGLHCEETQWCFKRARVLLMVVFLGWKLVEFNWLTLV